MGRTTDRSTPSYRAKTSPYFVSADPALAAFDALPVVRLVLA
jgi:hypothetical protein